jgi:hypothetical protein
MTAMHGKREKDLKGRIRQVNDYPLIAPKFLAKMQEELGRLCPDRSEYHTCPQCGHSFKD